MSNWLLAEFAAAAALVLFALLRGAFSVRRDFFMLAVYLQSLLYLYLGPFLRLRKMTDPPNAEYALLGAASLVLFSGVFILVAAALRPPSVEQAAEAAMSIAPARRRLEILIWSAFAFSAAFWWIANTHTLVFRRVGGMMIPLQLQLPFVKFFLYRLYIEALPFLVALLIVALIVGGKRLSVAVRAAAVASLASAWVYYVINSRLCLGLVVLMILGVWCVTWRGARGFAWRFAVAGAAAVLLLLYSNATTERMRVGWGLTGTVQWRAFVPGMRLDRAPATETMEIPSTVPTGPVPGEEIARGARAVIQKAFLFQAAAEMPFSIRTDGLDLMVRMLPAIQQRGRAWGRAWVAPVQLVYLPVTDPQRAREMKLAFDMTAKNYLMRTYASLDEMDHVSCLLTDAWGSFGWAGIAAAAAFLAMGTTLSGRALVRPTRGLWIVVALFAISHLLPFEQEFVSAAVLWVKKLPLLLAVVILAPFRVVAARDPKH
jgi:hypothetical protein